MEAFENDVKQYLDEIMRPGIPYVSQSHGILKRLYGLYGRERVDERVNKHFKQLAENTS